MATVLEPPKSAGKRKRLNSFVRPPYAVKRWTLEEFRRLVDLGFLSNDDRIELLEGWIVPKMTQYPPHSWALLNAHNILMPGLGTDWHLRSQLPVETSDSEPEPDLAVVRGSIDRYLHRHPTTGEVALIVEIADSSRQKDRRKARIYASIGVPNYWIINLTDRQIEVHSTPNSQKRQYQERRILAEKDRLELNLDGRPSGEFLVEQFLPPEEAVESTSP